MMMEMFRKMSDDAAKRETLLLAEIKNLSQGRFEAKQNGEKPPEFNGRWPLPESSGVAVVCTPANPITLDTFFIGSAFDQFQGG